MTSQILGNIYLNEFDRYVQHCLKPLAYVRYGDDMVFWLRSEHEAVSCDLLVKDFLLKDLKLAVHQNSTVQRANQMLHFLGIELWPSGRRLDKRMRKRTYERICYGNYASYYSMVTQHERMRCKARLRDYFTQSL